MQYQEKEGNVKAGWRKKLSGKKGLSYLQALWAWHWCWSRLHCWWLCTHKWLRLCVCAVAGSAEQSLSRHQTQSPWTDKESANCQESYLEWLCFFPNGVSFMQHIIDILSHVEITVVFALCSWWEGFSSLQFKRLFKSPTSKLHFSVRNTSINVTIGKTSKISS